jgi:hypothetical protein
MSDVSFNDRTPQALQAMEQVHDRTTEKIASTAVSLMKRIVPIDTSRLQKSIAWRALGRAIQVFTQTAAGGKPGYGYWVEVGTAHMEAQPYGRPGIQRAGEIVLKGQHGLGWLSQYLGRGHRTRSTKKSTAWDRAIKENIRRGKRG